MQEKEWQCFNVAITRTGANFRAHAVKVTLKILMKIHAS